MNKDLPREAKDTMLGVRQWILANEAECAGNIANGVVKARQAKIDAAKSN